jgi:hypothetical protein
MLRLAKNFGGELKEGLTNSAFRLEIRYTATNTSGVALNLVSRINVCQNSVFLLAKGSPIRQINGVSSEEFAQALANNSYSSSGMDPEIDENSDLTGGGNFSNMFRNAGKFLIRSLDVGNKLLQSAAQIYPETGVGQVAYEMGRANQLSQAMNQNLNLGAGMMGGSRLEMLKASGLLK